MASGGVRIDALLAQHGLRSKASGYQVTTEEVVRAQCGGLFESFGKLRRRRSGSEYPRQLMRRIVRMVAPLLLRNGMRCHRGVSSLPAVNCASTTVRGSTSWSWPSPWRMHTDIGTHAPRRERCEPPRPAPRRGHPKDQRFPRRGTSLGATRHAKRGCTSPEPLASPCQGACALTAVLTTSSTVCVLLHPLRRLPGEERKEAEQQKRGQSSGQIVSQF